MPENYGIGVYTDIVTCCVFIMFDVPHLHGCRNNTHIYIYIFPLLYMKPCTIHIHLVQFLEAPVMLERHTCIGKQNISNT